MMTVLKDDGIREKQQLFFSSKSWEQKLKAQ
jgi:hypothetical protein